MEAHQYSPANSNRTRWLALLIVSIAFFLMLLFSATVAVFASGFVIQPDEVGVVLRFGEVIRIAEPGRHSKLPTPIEQVLKVPIQRQFKEEFGFRTVEAGNPDQEPQRDVEGESLMITGDLNIVAVDWITQYRITDPVKYLFEVRGVTETFRELNEAVMRAAVGDRSIDEIITIGRLEIEDEVTLHLQELCDHLETGIIVDQVVLYDVSPPEPVKPAFDDINKAEQESHRAIRDAQAMSKPARAGAGS